MTQETRTAPKNQATSRSYTWAAPTISQASVTTNTASSAVIPAGEYRVVATKDAWITFAATPVAAGHGDGCMFLPAGQPVFLQVEGDTKLGTIRDAADGYVNMSKTD